MGDDCKEVLYGEHTSLEQFAVLGSFSASNIPVNIVLLPFFVFDSNYMCSNLREVVQIL